MERWKKARDLANAVERFQGVQIENRCALDLAKDFDEPTTLFYVDPPYPEDTRSKRWRQAYSMECDTDFHVHLINMLKKLSGAVVVSSYPNDLYESELKEWKRVEKEVNTISHGSKATEVLWIKEAKQIDT